MVTHAMNIDIPVPERQRPPGGLGKTTVDVEDRKQHGDNKESTPSGLREGMLYQDDFRGYVWL